MIEILNNYKNDNDYIVKNYTLEQRIKMINELIEIQENDSIYSILNEIINSNDDYLKFFTPKEALNLLLKKGSIDINSFFETFLLTNLDDEGKRIILKKYTNDLDRYNKNQIISSFTNPKLMIDWLKENRDLYDITDLDLFLRNLSDTDLMYAIEKLSEEMDKYSLRSYFISKIKDIDKRAKIFITFNLNRDAFNIVDQIKDEDLIAQILKNINSIENEYQAQKFALGLNKISNVDSKNSILLKYFINDFSSIVLLIKALDSIDKKSAIDAILYLSKEEPNLAIELVNFLEDEESMIYVIDNLKDKIHKVQQVGILITMPKDSVKLKYIKELELNRRELIAIISSINDDKIKKELALEYMEIFSEVDFYHIIQHMKSDEVKLEIINDSRFGFQSFQRARLIEYIKDSELRLSLIASEALKSRNYGWLEERILHDDELINCKTINYSLLKYYAETRKVNLENLSLLTEKFGYITLRFIDNKKIKKIINSDKEILNKLLSLFDKDNSLKLNESIIDSIYESIIQRIFRNTNPNNIFNLFHELKYYVLIDDKKNLLLELNEIKESGLIDFNKFNIDVETLVNDLIDKKLYAIDTLKKITDEYLIKKRNEYSNLRKDNLHQDINLNIMFEKNYLINLFLSQNPIEDIINIIDKIDLEMFDSECKNLLINKELLKECLKFKKAPNEYGGNFIKIKEYLKTINNIFDIIYEKDYYTLQSNCVFADEVERKKCKLDLNINNSENILKIMSELDIEQLNDVLFSNEKVYNELLTLLYKYKILGWNNIFESVLDEAGIEFDSSVSACLISYFYKFYPELIKKLEKGDIKTISLLNILDEVNIFSSSSNLYSLLLKEDYSYIAKNPAPNSANLSKEQRLRKIPEKIKKMYERKYITIPPLQENIQLNDDKSLNVTIGDVTSTINLTYGERTESCMRIGAPGDSLFNFCLGNENGFHVRMSDPATGKLVSRVSGFRNGNTVFLNQLRDSLDDNYKAEDLINVVEKIAKIIIDKTKDSRYPVENVIISNHYAMSSRSIGKVNFSEDIKKGYEYFYTDVSDSNAILLASANDDNSLVPLKLNPENCEKYEVLRDKISYITDKTQILKNISRLHIIKELLDGVNISDIELNQINSNISSLYIGQDWYLALDENDNILYEFYINRGLSKTFEEMNYVKNNLLNNNSKEGRFSI